MRATPAHRSEWGRGREGCRDEARDGGLSIMNDKFANERLSFDPRATVLSGEFRKNVAFHGK
jgi:hypothetical protein